MSNGIMGSLWDALKKKGIVLTKSIPVGPPPVDIDHEIHKALERAKIKVTLEKAHAILWDISESKGIPSGDALSSILHELQMRLCELDDVDTSR